MKDTQLRQDIIDELQFEPSIDAADIGVAVEDGTVTLTGHVRTYAERCTAENLVKRVKGVRAIAQEIEVRPEGGHITADDEIAKRAANMLRWNCSIPRERILVKVEKGAVTLSGTVSWYFEKAAAERALRGLTGVRSIINQIEIVPSVSVADIRQRIEDALKRDAEVDADRIHISVTDHRVTIEGKVKSWAEKYAVERAAWAVPGVSAVIDYLAIDA